MKRILLTLVLILVFGVAYADEVPALRPSSPDVPSEVKGDYAAPPQSVKSEEVQTENAEEETEEEEDDTDVEEETTEEENTTPVNNEQKESAEPADTTPDVEANPINNDATNDNLDKLPPASTEKVKRVKHKKQKVKKEKPKYGKYKDADTDPYIQSWEEELKQYNEMYGTEEGPAQKAKDDKEKAEAAKKTYTQADYEQAYRDMPVPTFSYVHGVDPDQYYDMKSTSWSPYPLLRLNSPLYFKTITVQPGYYLLTPRQYKDDWYILFKEAGAVKYTIPVFDKSHTPEFYYRDTLKEADMTRSARWQVKFLHAWGKYIRKSKRRPEVKCNIELTDLDNNFLLLDLYYGAHKYSTIFRIEKF